MLDQEHYLGHCKVDDLTYFLCVLSLMFSSYSSITISFQPIVQDHPKDSEFLNTPIRFYIEMEAIFGGNLAIGRYAVGSGEPLGQF